MVERLCRERMKIPVFHDDQHGTAIVVGAAATNALRVADKAFGDIKIVSTGGGAAGIACLNMLIKLGARRENIWLCDLHGLVHEGRAEEMNPEKAAFAQPGGARGLGDVIDGADLFLGLSGPGVLKAEMVRRMAGEPDRLRAGATRTRRSTPQRHARRTRTSSSPPGGRTIRTRSTTSSAFRSSSAARSTSARPRSTTRWRSPASRASPALARASSSAEAAAAYQGERLSFGRDYLIPKPFDPRLLRHRGRRRGRGGDGERRGDAAGRRPRGLQGRAQPLGLPLGLHHAPRSSTPRAPSGGASSSPRARTSGCCMPCTRSTRSRSAVRS